MYRRIATIDATGFCFSTAEGDFPPERALAENEIDVTDFPFAVGKYYRNGEWVEPEEDTAPTTQEMLAEVLLNAEYMACLMEEQLENE